MSEKFNSKSIEMAAGKEEGESSHKEAVEFVNSHRDFFEHYARGRVNFEPAPEGLNTFAFVLKDSPEMGVKENTIFVNSRFYKDRGFSDEKTAFATLHETEHFLEKKFLLAEEGGERTFGRYLKQLEESQAYGLMDNCLADIRENKNVVLNTNESYRQLETDLYKNDLFKERDFTKEPKHIQLPQAILRENRLPDEKCEVSPEVREKLEEFYKIKSKDGNRLVDAMTDPATPMSLRLKLQDYYVWPMVKELLENDLREKEKQGGGEGKSGEGKKEQGKKGKGKNKNKGKEEIKNSVKGEKGEKLDSNEIFKEAYKRAKEKTPDSVPLKNIKKAFEEWQKAKEENPLEVADKEYAEKLGVKKEDLRKYRDIVNSLEKIINPETNENVIQELRNLIERIIAKRVKLMLAPRYPVEEGEDLVEPAELVAGVRAGNLEPRVWETYEIKEKKGQQFGEVEITLVCDRSGSMAGEKIREQQKAAALLMEALKEFSERAEEEKINLMKPLEIRSEIYSFQATAGDSVPIKKMSSELGEKERVDAVGILSSAPGLGTTDFVPLETIYKNLNNDDKKKILEGELKKIVIVFTDGESDDASRVKKILNEMRQNGVAAVGVGITTEGKTALSTYAPDARLAEKAEDLALVLSDLLKEHLADI